jgi:SAM-dependent methyltransferase
MGDQPLNPSRSSQTQPAALVDFVCNICGASNRQAPSDFDREVPSCAACNSTVRTRAIMHVLSRELFGADLAIPEFPRLKSLRGLGISDSDDYAQRLAEKFSYRNTFYHREPKLDIVDPPENEFGTYDFIISSEVFEHVPPPAERAFAAVRRLLKPNGVFLLTVPYTLEQETAEHFPDLHDYSIVSLASGAVLVNRTAEGEIQTFDRLVFHGGGGAALEMRRFCERDLRRIVADAGFTGVEIYGAGYSPFGIYLNEQWSLPMAVRKEPFSLPRSAVADVMEQYAVIDRELSRIQPEFEKRTKWALDLDAQLQERTAWALNLQKALDEHVQTIQRLQAGFNGRVELTMASGAPPGADEEVVRQIERLQRELIRLRTALWTRIGRKLRIVS